MLTTKELKNITETVIEKLKDFEYSTLHKIYYNPKTFEAFKETNLKKYIKEQEVIDVNTIVNNYKQYSKTVQSFLSIEKDIIIEYLEDIYKKAYKLSRYSKDSEEKQKFNEIIASTLQIDIEKEKVTFNTKEKNYKRLQKILTKETYEYIIHIICENRYRIENISFNNNLQLVFNKIIYSNMLSDSAIFSLNILKSKNKTNLLNNVGDINRAISEIYMMLHKIEAKSVLRKAIDIYPLKREDVAKAFDLAFILKASNKLTIKYILGTYLKKELPYDLAKVPKWVELPENISKDEVNAIVNNASKMGLIEEYEYNASFGSYYAYAVSNYIIDYLDPEIVKEVLMFDVEKLTDKELVDVILNSPQDIKEEDYFKVKNRLNKNVKFLMKETIRHFYLHWNIYKRILETKA